MQRISRFRMIVFIVVILAMIAVFSLRLYKTQAAVTEESLVAADADSMTYQSTVEAARGNILDRNGNVLVSNRASYNLVIVNFVFFNAPDPNGNLLKVLDLCDRYLVRRLLSALMMSLMALTFCQTVLFLFQCYLGTIYIGMITALPVQIGLSLLACPLLYLGAWAIRKVGAK